MPRSLLLALAPLLLLLAACSGDDDDEPAEYAEPRAYAGASVAFEDYLDVGEVLFVSSLRDGSPAALAGLQAGDVIRSIDGESLESGRAYLAYLETKRPGDTVLYEIDRPTEVTAPDGSARPEWEQRTISVELIPEPLPDQYWAMTLLAYPYAAVDAQDQLRFGYQLAEITRPVAEYYGLDGPEGVIVADWISYEVEVMVSLMGRRVNSLAEVDAILQGLDEDEPIRITFRRNGREGTVVLPPMGPNIPGANVYPPEARKRLRAAIERGDLHPSRVPLNIYGFYWGTDPAPGEPATRTGAITALSADSITIEIYSTGSEWTLQLRRPEPDLRVGEFVQLFTRDGQTVWFHTSFAKPVERP